MIRRPPRSTRTDTLFPYTTLFPILLPVLGESIGAFMRIDADLRLSAHRANRSLTIALRCRADKLRPRSEEHTSELQSLMRISYAVFFLKKKKIMLRYLKHTKRTHLHHNHSYNYKNHDHQSHI